MLQAIASRTASGTPNVRSVGRPFLDGRGCSPWPLHAGAGAAEGDIGWCAPRAFQSLNFEPHDKVAFHAPEWRVRPTSPALGNPMNRAG